MSRTTRKRPLVFSPIQLDVLRLTGLGLCDKLIARELGIKPETVMAVRKNAVIKAKAHGLKWAKVLVDADGNQLDLHTVGAAA